MIVINFKVYCGDPHSTLQTKPLSSFTYSLLKKLLLLEAPRETCFLNFGGKKISQSLVQGQTNKLQVWRKNSV